MNTPAPAPDSYYERIDELRYKPTAHAGGAWDPAELHFSPLGGLVVHAIERQRAGRPDDGLVLARISYDILGRLALDECEIRVETVRPGRTIELVEAVVLVAGRSSGPVPGSSPPSTPPRSRAARTTGSPLPSSSPPGR